MADREIQIVDDIQLLEPVSGEAATDEGGAPVVVSMRTWLLRAVLCDPYWAKTGELQDISGDVEDRVKTIARERPASGHAPLRLPEPHWRHVKDVLDKGTPGPHSYSLPAIRQLRPFKRTVLEAKLIEE